jgi:hypothetical protein
MQCDVAASVHTATAEESADGVPGCGYLITGDDFSTLRLFNYPAVWDDAPYKAFRRVTSAISHCSEVAALTCTSWCNASHQRQSVARGLG